MKTIILILILSIFLPFITFSQTPKKVDSLQSILNSVKHDTLKIDALNSLFSIYEFSDTLKAKKFLQQAMSLSEKINHKKRIAYTYSHYGFYYEDQGLLNVALENHQKAKIIYEEIKNDQGLASCYNNIGLIYLKRGNYSDALKIFQKALNLFEKLNDKKRIADTYINIGNIHDYQDNLPQAREYYEKALTINIEIDNKKRIAACYNNIGSVLYRMKNYKKALEYNQKSLQINEMLKSKKGMAYNYVNIGLIYSFCKQYTESMEYYNKALNLYRVLDNKKEICTVFANIAALDNILGKFHDAVSSADSCLLIAKKAGLLENEMDSYKELSKAYEGLADFQQAYKNHVKFKQINDSLVNTDKNEQLSRMEALFQNEKKQKEIELSESKLLQQALEVKHQKTQISALIFGLLLVLILLLVIFRSYRQKKKANILLQEKNEEILQQKEEIKSQRDQIESQLEISEKQRGLITHQKKELTDSINYAQRIQRAILPPSYYVKKCLPDSFIMYLPKDVVSGDFYYVEKLNEYVIFAAVDCTGHGVAGSMMSVIGYNLINQAVKLNHLTKPSEILGFLDAGVTETLRQAGGESGVNDGMDIAVCSLNTETNLLQFAGAYNGILYVKGNEMTEIKADNLAIGVNYDGIVDTYTNHEIPMEKGDVVYLYSDGFADQFGGPKGKKFKYKQLKELLLENASLSIKEQNEHLINAFVDWKGDLEQVDDVMVIGIKI